MSRYFPLFLSVVSTVVGCKTAQEPVAQTKANMIRPERPEHTSFSPVSYPQPDTELGEELYDGEVESARTIAAIIERTIADRFGSGRYQRDAHPKAHGCVKAKVTVNNDIDPELQTSVFQPGAQYDAILRFSNGNGDPTIPDLQGDGRGLAMKLQGVPGRKLLDVEAQATTQDFIMINHPAFIIDDPDEYIDVVNSAGSSSLFARAQLLESLGLRGAKVARAIQSIQISSPLNTQYFSMTPYQWGSGESRQAVKFSAKPCRLTGEAIPSNAHKNYLRHRLVDHLADQGHCFDFMVQVGNGEMNVERSTVEWEQGESPFISVARIEIAPQALPRMTNDEPGVSQDNVRQNHACDTLSYNPWHANADHKPLGAVNRMRKVIYEHISKVRHAHNREPRQEPN